MTGKPNMSADLNAVYSWDRENRLTSASAGIAWSSYAYDALGRRVQRTDNLMLSVQKYTYDGLDVVLDDNDGRNMTYQNGPGIDNKLKLDDRGTSKYFLQDHLGSTVGLADSSGNVTESNSYDSFGNPSNGGLSTRYQYTGREYEPSTGLQYSRARFYDPQIGRFISEDPIGFRGRDVNLYGYVRNNPLRFLDPTGLQVPEPVPNPTPRKYSPSNSCGCSPPGTLQLGVSGLGILGPGFGVAGQLGAGVAFDGSGNIIAYTEYGGGAGVGASVSGTVNVNGSNAPTVYGLPGTFYNLNLNGGAGYDAGLNAFGNRDLSIVGGGFSLGGGAGAGVGATRTWTDLHGGFNIWDLAGIGRPTNICR